MITLILGIAAIATYQIYHKFVHERTTDYNSESLEITFHEKTGNKVTIIKAAGVTDSVGLSSKAYTFSIKNNSNQKVKYKLLLVDDNDTIEEDNCLGKEIPKEFLRVSIKKNDQKAEIYSFDELENDILSNEEIKNGEEKEYAIRVWVTNSTDLPSLTNLHYHGIIQILENDNSLAVKWEK